MGAESVVPRFETATYETDHAAFAAGVVILGGQAATARLLKKSQPTIHRRLKDGKPIWAERDVIEAFEQATGISRFELRRDLFRPDSTTPIAAGCPTGMEHVR